MTRSPPLKARRRRVPGRLVGAAFGAALFAAGWFVAPRPELQERWVEPEIAGDVGRWVAGRSTGVSDLRRGEGHTISWADSTRTRTPLSVVYLHGFSADRHEIEPVVSDLGRRLGANVYFPRLRGHGRSSIAMAEATPEDWLDDAVEALAIGERLGERVLVIGTSTGGTLATWLAASERGRERLGALVLVSPNFGPRDRSAGIFLQPGGEWLARIIVGSERCWTPLNEQQERHWTTCYPISALTSMMVLVAHVRTMDLSTVRVPTLVLYSSRDDVVDSRRTLETMEAMTGTDVRLFEVDTTTDPAHHVLAGDIVSPGSSALVLEEITDWVRQHLSEQTMPGTPRD